MTSLLSTLPTLTNAVKSRRILRQSYSIDKNTTAFGKSGKGYYNITKSTKGKGAYYDSGATNSTMPPATATGKSKGKSKGGKGGKGSKGYGKRLDCPVTDSLLCDSIQDFDGSMETCFEMEAVADMTCPTQEEVCSGTFDPATYCAACSGDTCIDFLETCCLIECCEDTCLGGDEICVFLNLVDNWMDPDQCDKYNFDEFCPCSVDERTTEEYCDEIVGDSTCYLQCQDYVNACCESRNMVDLNSTSRPTESPTLAPIVFNCTCQTITGTLGEAGVCGQGNTTMMGRLDYYGSASTCVTATPKAPPATRSIFGSFAYDTYGPFTNSGPAPVCANVEFDFGSCLGDFSSGFLAYPLAYSTFDPANQQSGYLGDVGLDVGNPFNITLQNDESFVLIVQQSSANSGALGCSYSFRVDLENCS